VLFFSPVPSRSKPEIGECYPSVLTTLVIDDICDAFSSTCRHFACVLRNYLPCHRPVSASLQRRLRWTRTCWSLIGQQFHSHLLILLSQIIGFAHWQLVSAWSSLRCQSILLNLSRC